MTGIVAIGEIINVRKRATITARNNENYSIFSTQIVNCNSQTKRAITFQYRTCDRRIYN
jgi:hypothetical protein